MREGTSLRKPAGEGSGIGKFGGEGAGLSAPAGRMGMAS